MLFCQLKADRSVVRGGDGGSWVASAGGGINKRTAVRALSSKTAFALRPSKFQRCLCLRAQGVFQTMLEKLVTSQLTNDEALEGQIHGLELTNCRWALFIFIFAPAGM